MGMLSVTIYDMEISLGCTSNVKSLKISCAHLNFSRLDHVSLGLTYAKGIKASELISMVEAYNLLIKIRL
jgi:hypothetical protein